MDQVASLSVLYAEVKMKKSKPLTIQQVSQEEEMGSLHEIKKGQRVSFWENKSRFTAQSFCLPPELNIQISSLPTLGLPGMGFKSSFKRVKKSLKMSTAPNNPCGSSGFSEHPAQAAGLVCFGKNLS